MAAQGNRAAFLLNDREISHWRHGDGVRRLV